MKLDVETIMKTQNEHKILISKILQSKQPLQKWEARVIANRLIGELILSSKNLNSIVEKGVENSEFKTKAQIRELNNKLKKSRENNLSKTK